MPFSAVCSGDEPDLAGCGRPLEPDMCLPHCGVENTIAIICPSSSAKVLSSTGTPESWLSPPVTVVDLGGGGGGLKGCA